MEDNNMNRRELIKGIGGAGLGLGAGLLDAAHAADLPTVRWRLTSSFPKSLDILFGAADQFAERVKQLTGGKFEIKTFAGGEIVPPLKVFDAVQDGTVECGHTASYYYVGKNMALAFDTAVPFGLTARQQNAWLYSGGGLELLREFFKGFNIINFPGGNTGTQMGGWFRKPLKTAADLKGLKMRIPGLGGQIMSRLGVVPQTIAGADIYPALEKGTIDATEWVGPYDDEKLGFYKVAKNYYYPGWWEGSAMLSFYVNLKQWQDLPPPYQAALSTAAAEVNVTMVAEYDARNAPALARLLSQGVKLHAFPQDVMRAARKIATDIYAEEAGKNAAFKTIYEQWKNFAQVSQQWFKVAEASFANFVYFTK
jgi:TRAP-type mannitol/chloroaromatic compound transport system substrate-binding protein